MATLYVVGAEWEWREAVRLVIRGLGPIVSTSLALEVIEPACAGHGRPVLLYDLDSLPETAPAVCAALRARAERPLLIGFTRDPAECPARLQDLLDRLLPHGASAHELRALVADLLLE